MDMHKASIGTTQDSLILECVGVDTVIKGIKHRPGYGKGDLVEDLLLVLLEDKTSPTTSIGAMLNRLESYLVLARTYHTTGVGLPVYLMLTPLENEAWWSRVVDGWCEQVASKGASSNGIEEQLKGSVAVALHLVRENYWEQAVETQFPTWGILGNNHLDGTLITNQHAASLVSNFLEVRLDEGDAEPNLPMICRLVMEYASATDNLANLWVSQGFNSRLSNTYSTLEDNTASGGVSANDPTSSGGTYRLCTWEGTQEAELLVWTIPSAMSQACAGNFFKFLLKLSTVLAYTDLSLKLKVRLAGTSNTIGASNWKRLAPTVKLHELAVLRIPPNRLADNSQAADMELVLTAKRGTTGGSIGVDFIQLLPLDGWRRYGAIDPIGPGDTIEDDGWQNTLITYGADRKQVNTHIGVGPGFRLQPRQRNIFFFNWSNSYDQVVLDKQLRVKVFGRIRRKIL